MKGKPNRQFHSLHFPLLFKHYSLFCIICFSLIWSLAPLLLCEVSRWWWVDPPTGRSRLYPHYYHPAYQHWVDKTSFQKRKGKVLSHQVQFGTKATAEEYRKWHKIVKLVIHPDYWQVSLPASNIKKTKCFDTGTKWSCPTPWCGPGNDWEWGYCMIFQKVMDCHNKISKS